MGAFGGGAFLLSGDFVLTSLASDSAAEQEVEQERVGLGIGDSKFGVIGFLGDSSRSRTCSVAVNWGRSSVVQDLSAGRRSRWRTR
jgi:hypothetical protein